MARKNRKDLEKVFRKIINKIKFSIWLYPAVYSIAAFALAILVYFADSNFSADLSAGFAGMFYADPVLAKDILGIIAGAFITIATFTFSTAMVVLTMYSSQFTPRVVENFLNNQTTMKSFGVFMSGFIYSVTSLLLMRSADGENPVMSAGIGVLYVIIGLIYFLIFIQNVSTHIQASGLILRLHNEALSEIGKYKNYIKDKQILAKEEFHDMISDKQHMDIYSIKDGYIQEIDQDKLYRISQEHDCTVCIRKVIGQFISNETRIISVYHQSDEPIEKDMAASIQSAVIVGNKRTEDQDFSFTIQKIVEIALKALSPGINDPHTAIHCLKILGVLLQDLADIPSGYTVIRDKEGDAAVLSESYDFNVLIYDAYHQVMHYGRSDAAVMIAVMKSLRMINAKVSEENAVALNEYAALLMGKIEGNGYDELEISKIKREYKDLLNIRK